ncbi:hypothetical protein [Streptomyces sp. NPDC018059]|uniref:hypothetical protein n=1 Tax=Streptomyces sp. NPDC018059 TaxID=3365041 RepID=UPI0037A83903
MRSDGGGPPVGAGRATALDEGAPSRTAPAALVTAPNVARPLHREELARRRAGENPRDVKKPRFSAVIIPAHPDVDRKWNP